MKNAMSRVSDARLVETLMENVKGCIFVDTEVFKPETNFFQSTGTLQ